MKWIRRPSFLAVIAALAIGAAFLGWYRGAQAPLSPAEQAHYLERVAQLQDATSGFNDLATMREFLQSDDGKPFYIVNVFRFRDTAQYANAGEGPISGVEAFQRFTTLVLPFWIKRGTHPVFTTTLSPHFVNDWHLVSVVRYRSRRDFIATQTSDEFVAALPHRLAATEANIRLKLPGLQIPAPALPLALLLSALIGAGFVIEARRNRNRGQSPSSAE